MHRNILLRASYLLQRAATHLSGIFHDRERFTIKSLGLRGIRVLEPTSRLRPSREETTNANGLFADDALLYGNLLQSDLRSLESWLYHWQMEFNPFKSKIVTISHKNNPPQRKYVFCGVELEQVDSFPYLAQVVSPCFHDSS